MGWRVREGGHGQRAAARPVRLPDAVAPVRPLVGATPGAAALAGLVLFVGAGPAGAQITVPTAPTTTTTAPTTTTTAPATTTTSPVPSTTVPRTTAPPDSEQPATTAPPTTSRAVASTTTVPASPTSTTASDGAVPSTAPATTTIAPAPGPTERDLPGEVSRPPRVPLGTRPAADLTWAAAASLAGFAVAGAMMAARWFATRPGSGRRR